MSRIKGLGMGMDALFTENESQERATRTLRITEIFPNKQQPRSDFDEESLAALAESIKQHGVLQSRAKGVGGLQEWRGLRKFRC